MTWEVVFARLSYVREAEGMAETNEVKKLKKERAGILKEIRGIGNLMRGSMYDRERKCGGKGCWCSKSETGHPQTMLTLHFKGEQIVIAVPKGKKEEVLSMIGEYDKLWELIEKLTRINIKMIRSER